MWVTLSNLLFNGVTSELDQIARGLVLLESENV